MRPVREIALLLSGLSTSPKRENLRYESGLRSCNQVMVYSPLKEAEKHLFLATCERSYYRTSVQGSRDTIKRHFTTVPPPGAALPAGSGPDSLHYSFDFAQQVHYPHNPLQPGPMYFKTARKCAVFGICCEGIPREVTYLIDEASDVGKGANTVISFLHHFFQHHGLGEVDVGLHADNCVGQMQFYR